MGDYRYDEKEGFDGRMIKVLGSTFEEGKPESREDWKEKLGTREERVTYLKTALRYWYNKEWYGSERRKQEA